MPWPVVLLDIVGTRLVELPTHPDSARSTETRLVDDQGKEYRYPDLPPGSMFFGPGKVGSGVREVDCHAWPWWLAGEDWLSDYYRQHNAHRRPLLVVLPGRDLFCVDGMCWKAEKRGGLGEVERAHGHRIQ